MILETELFSFLERLSTELDDMDQRSLANRIQRAARISSVTIEVLMAIRFELRQLLLSDPGLTQATKLDVETTIRVLNEALDG